MLSRREFIVSAAATSVVAAARPWRLIDAYADVAAQPPFDHVVVLMMENRSFDHFLGWLPGADGKQAGLTFDDIKGTTYPTYNLGNDYQGCGYADPDHSYRGFRTQYDGGRLDGFLRTAAPGDTFPIGYYTEPAIPVLGALAREYTISDHYFCSIMAETYPNRFYQHAAATDRPVNTMATSSLPTIWDRLAAAGLSGRYYSTDAPFLALWGARHADIINPAERFFADCAAGTLANVSFVDPAFLGEGQGLSRDDHPHADIRSGEVFIRLVYNAVRSSPQWSRTILVINYDEWGGFFDHVLPPKVVDNSTIPAESASIPPPDPHQLGFRVPCVVVSPFSPRGGIVSGGAPFDHTSVLRMIEWRWGLPPLNARDANARNLAELLDFRLQRTDVPVIPGAPVPTTTACGVLSVAASPPAAIPHSPGPAAQRAPRPGSGVAGATPNPAAATGGTEAPTLAAASGLAAVAAGRRRAARRNRQPSSPPTTESIDD